MPPGNTERTWLDRVVPVLTVLGCLVVAALGVGTTFNSDEWDFISRDPNALASWFAPHNQHWSTLPYLGYRLLLASVGLRTYVPYLVVLLMIHAVVVIGAYRLNRRLAGTTIAALLAVPTVFMGSGAENLFWAFQIGLLGAVACGLWALVAVDVERPGRRRIVMAALLLVASVASSAVGLVFVVVVAIDRYLRGGFRDAFAVAAVPVIAFVGWLAAVVAFGIGPARVPGPGDPAGTLGAFVGGIGAGAGALAGLGPTLGILLVPLVVAVPVLAIARRWPTRARVVAAVGGVLAMSALVAAGRTALEPGIEASPRYTYVTFVLLTLSVAEIVPVARPALSRPAVRVGAAAVLALSVAWNLLLLVEVRATFLERADYFRAIVATAVDPAALPDVPSDVPLDPYPSRDALRRLLAEYGDATRDALVPGLASQPSSGSWARARAWLEETASGG